MVALPHRFIFAIPLIGLSLTSASAEEIKLRCFGTVPDGANVVVVLNIDTSKKSVHLVETDTKPGVLRRRIVQDFRDKSIGPMMSDFNIEDLSGAASPGIFPPAKVKALRDQFSSLQILANVSIDDDHFAVEGDNKGRKAEVFTIDRATGEYLAAGGKIALKCAKGEKKF